MMFFSSAMLKPVSFCSWSTYVNAGLPLFLAPCFGSQSSRSLITSSFFLQQCPINRSLLIISVSVILGRLPYSSLLVLCSFQETPRTALSILVYVPSSLLLIFSHRPAFSTIKQFQHLTQFLTQFKHFQLWSERNLLWGGCLALISTLSSFCWVHSKLVHSLYSCPTTSFQNIRSPFVKVDQNNRKNANNSTSMHANWILLSGSRLKLSPWLKLLSGGEIAFQKCFVF